jgi:IS30 family transposase
MTLDVRELIRRLRLQQSYRGIARDLGCARKTIRKYHKLALEHNLLDGDLPEPGSLDKLLNKIIPEPPAPATSFKAEPWKKPIEKMLRKQVEFKVIHQRLVTEHGYTGSNSSVYRYIKRKPPRQQDISKVEFSASTFFLKTAGGSPPNDVCGRSSL